MVILYFFAGHYLLAIFCQTFFLHRYGAHRMFTMSKRWERFFHLLTYLSQGASYLNPRGYALLHRLHHAYSDTPRDPHSPTLFSNVVSMMWTTKTRYEKLVKEHETPEHRFVGGYPEWPLIDRLAEYRASSVLWVLFYVAFYAAFVTAPWQWLLLPAQILMGPMHGAIVNWCGHKYGYRNFQEVGDQSRNTLPLDLITMGELFQNNHHRFCTDPNFAKRWFEVDPTYVVIRLLAALNVVQLLGIAAVPYQNHVENELSWGVPLADAKEA